MGKGGIRAPLNALGCSDANAVFVGLFCMFCDEVELEQKGVSFLKQLKFPLGMSERGACEIRWFVPLVKHGGAAAAEAAARIRLGR